MQRMELQFYAFFMTVLSGVGLGLLFDLLRAVRSFLRPGQLLAAVGDLLFWSAATVMMASGLFLGNWGEYRFYVLVGILLGLALYYWLASPTILWLTEGLLRLAAWLLGLIWSLLVRLIWEPFLAIGRFGYRLVSTVGQRLAEWIVDLLWRWVWRPLVRRPYRWAKLHYLLTKRRVRRALRRWLLGPKPPRPR